MLHKDLFPGSTYSLVVGQTLLSKTGAPVKLTGWAFATRLERIFVLGCGVAATPLLSAAAADRISSADAL